VRTDRSSAAPSSSDHFATSPRIAIAVAPRLLARLSLGLPDGGDQSAAPIGEAIWSDTRLLLGDLPASQLKNLFTGETIDLAGSALPLSTALANFPVALLTNAD
jgi:maltooligosyltrehalose synthase